MFLTVIHAQSRSHLVFLLHSPHRCLKSHCRCSFTGCGSRCGCHQDEEAKNGRDDDEKRHSREVKPEVQKEESKKQGGPAVLFIGEDGPTLTNLLIGRSQAKVLNSKEAKHLRAKDTHGKCHDGND